MLCCAHVNIQVEDVRQGCVVWSSTVQLVIRSHQVLTNGTAGGQELDRECALPTGLYFGLGAPWTTQHCQGSGARSFPGTHSTSVILESSWC